MAATVVTVSSQVGAGGAAIGRGVAEKLRFRYYDWEVTSQAAAAAGVSPEVLAANSERAPTFIERMMARLAASGEDIPAVPTAPRPSMFTSEDYRQFIEQVVRELAKLGDAVILGHAGQAILSSQPGVLKVLIRGSMHKRVERLARLQETTPADARETIEQSDRQRTDFFRRAYHMDIVDASRYDVVLNSDFISPQTAIDVIAACARELS